MTTFPNQEKTAIKIKPMPEDGILFKAVRPSGTDFRTDRVQWAPPDDHNPEQDGPWVVKHPLLVKQERGEYIGRKAADPNSLSAANYLSASVTPLELPGSSWPLRMLQVKALGKTGRHSDYPGKVSAVKFEVVGEIEPWVRFGPQGLLVALLAQRWNQMSPTDRGRIERYVREPGLSMKEAVYEVSSRTYNALGRQGMGDARAQIANTLAGFGSGFIHTAVTALMIRHTIGKPDGITQRDYDLATAPARLAYGPIHPADSTVLSGLGRIREHGEKPRATLSDLW